MEKVKVTQQPLLDMQTEKVTQLDGSFIMRSRHIFSKKTNTLRDVPIVFEFEKDETINPHVLLGAFRPLKKPFKIV